MITIFSLCWVNRIKNRDCDNKFDLYTCASDTDDDFTIVRGKQSKRQRASSSDQSGSFSQAQLNAEADKNCDYDPMTNDEKLTLILSKVSVNESRVRASWEKGQHKKTSPQTPQATAR